MSDWIEYVIYCRKSTDESSEHQKQSIPDQIRACLNFAEKEWVTIKKKPKDFSDFENELDLKKEDDEVDLMNRRTYQETRWLYIIKEQKTAKLPYKRKKWSALIEKIKKWEIKWLISYSPDRQARNMLEWGQLIYFVDSQEINLELKYTNFQFEPTASGKMMLWIWFVFSKQYADKLSEDVGRWNKSAVEWGRALWRHKPWYEIKNNRHIPHPEHFTIIQEAFRMKLDWETDKTIADFINANGYKRVYKKWNVSFALADNLWDMFRDPFYYGKFVHGDNVTDLRETSSAFVPMITEEQHYILMDRHLWNAKAVKKSKHKEEYADIAIFDNDFIKTSDWYWLSFGLPNRQRFENKIKASGWKLGFADVVSLHQISYRCTYPESKDYSKPFNAKEIDDAVYRKLKSFKISEQEFNEYVEFSRWELKEIEFDAKTKRQKKLLEISRTISEQNSYVSKNMWIKRDEVEEKIYQREKKRYEEKIAFLQNEMQDIIDDERNEILELEAFLDLLQNISEAYKEATYVQKWKLAKLLFLNIVLDNQKRLTFAVKPWLEHLFMVDGSDTENRTPVDGMKIRCPNH